MKGDFSRIRFNSGKNYTAVLQQQGRVALDADANEQTAIDAYLRDTANVDVIGKYGAPADAAGFAIEIKNGKILIGRGRYYVDGILVENDKVAKYSEQLFLIPPTQAGAEQISEQDLIAALEAGKTAQFVLEVWRRFVTELDDPCLVEPAIGQADTTGRLQTVWRVVGMIGGAASASTSDSKEASGIIEATDPFRNAVDIAEIGEPAKCQNPILRLSSCCQLLYKTHPAQHTGKMSAKTTPGGDCGCQPIPAAGYQGLENQLYRVEIHTGGDFSKATFKWSRENASVVSKVTNVNDTIVTVNSLGADANLGFQAGNWVELSDDTNLYGDPPNQPGVLYQIQSPGPNPLQVTLASSVNDVDRSKNARMRRWDQPATSGTRAGIPLSATPVPLENGIEVTFSTDGNFVSGDYWTIPARTADGQIDWACGEHGDPLLLPQYFEIYTAPLACVQQAVNSPIVKPVGSDKKVNLPSIYVVDDCRLKFPPLNALSCGDQGPCTIVPKPGVGWEAPLLALNPGEDADICFPIGKFPLTKTVILEGLGNLRLSGGGFGTQILATGVTAALIFSKCNSVEISDLSASTDTVQIRNKRTVGAPALGGTLGAPALGGTLSFSDCVEVSIDSVALQCGYAEERTAACITVQNTFVAQTVEHAPITGWGEVRIRHCNLLVGGNQEGILLVRVGRAQIEDNTLVPYVPKRYTLNQRLQNRYFRASALRFFVSNARYVKAAQPGGKPVSPAANSAPAAPGAPPSAPANAAAGTSQPAQAANVAPAHKTDEEVMRVQQLKINATVTFGGQKIEFQTHPLLKDFWQPYLEANAPKTFSTNRDLLLFMKKAARSFLLRPKLHRGDTALINVIASLDKLDQMAMGRAISVGGEGIQECRILNNSIHDAVQGITVGMSNHKKYPPKTRESAGVVTIAGNQIYVGLPPRARFHACHAIFVGNVDSLMMENNYSQVIANPFELDREGIRVWGVFGRRIIVRHSHLVGFKPGIRFNPVEAPQDDVPLWLVADNMAEHAHPVVPPPLGFTVPPGTVPANVLKTWVNNLS
jgi:hypothetical protein